MSRKHFDEFIDVDSDADLERLKTIALSIKYDGISSVRSTKNGRFICGIHVGTNKRLAASSATREMAERAHLLIQECVKK